MILSITHNFILNGKNIKGIVNYCWYCDRKCGTFYYIPEVWHICRVCNECFFNIIDTSRMEVVTKEEFKEIQKKVFEEVLIKMFDGYEFEYDIPLLHGVIEKVISERCIKEIIE
jgi:hypothetical protein